MFLLKHFSGYFVLYFKFFHYLCILLFLMCTNIFTILLNLGKQCSIDALLEKTIKHMLFLQSVTKHADKLKEIGEPKVFVICSCYPFNFYPVRDIICGKYTICAFFYSCGSGVWHIVEVI